MKLSAIHHSPFAVVFIASLIGALSAFSQPDPKATPILQRTSAIYKALKSLEAQFSYTLENTAAKVKDTQTGSLLLQGPKFKLKIMGQVIQTEGTLVHTLIDEAKEVQMKSMEDFKAETELNPTTIFTTYDKGFKSKYVEEAMVKGKKTHVIDLFPENPDKKSFSRIRLMIDAATSQIISSKTFSKDGGTFTIEVTKQTPNATVAADDFKVDVAALKAKGYEVVDLR